MRADLVVEAEVGVDLDLDASADGFERCFNDGSGVEGRCLAIDSMVSGNTHETCCPIARTHTNTFFLANLKPARKA
jgi:hypothetical protein